MIDDTGKIVAPVSVADVAAALPADSRNVGVLCAGGHGRTAAWARHKPVRHLSLHPLTAAQLRDADHGLVPPAAADAALPAGAEWRQQVWSYAPPRGGAAEPFRPSDWDGYDPAARPPVSTPGALRITPVDKNTVRIPFGPNAMEIAGRDDLTPSDFSSLDGFYPCVVLYWTYEGVEQMRVRTSSRPFGSSPVSGAAVAFTPAELRALAEQAGTDSFSYFMCACDTMQTGLAHPLSAVYRVLPSERPLLDTLTVTDSLPLSVRFNKVWGYALSAGGFTTSGEDVSRYNPYGHIVPMPDTPLTPGGDPDDGGVYEYLGVALNYTVSLSAYVRNYGGSAITVAARDIFCRVAGNLAGHITPAINPAILRKPASGRLQQLDSISLAAGASAEFIFVWPRYSCVMNASGHNVAVPAGTRRFNAGFHLYIGNGQQARTLASVGLNIHN